MDRSTSMTTSDTNIPKLTSTNSHCHRTFRAIQICFNWHTHKHAKLEPMEFVVIASRLGKINILLFSSICLRNLSHAWIFQSVRTKQTFSLRWNFNFLRAFDGVLEFLYAKLRWKRWCGWVQRQINYFLNYLEQFQCTCSSAFWKHSGEHQKGREWFLKGESRRDECTKVIDAEEDRSERIGNSWKSRKRRIASEYEVHPRHLAHAYAATSFGIQWIVKFVYLYNGCAIVKLARPPIKFIEFWCMHALSYTRFGAMHSQSTEYSALKTVKCSMNRFIVHVSWLCVLSWLSQR